VKAAESRVSIAQQCKRLAHAARTANLKEIERLSKACPAAVRNWQPLMDACWYGHTDVVAFLLKAGADPNVLSANNHRHRPLHRILEKKQTIAQKPTHLAVVKLLLESGADVLAKGTCWGVSAVSVAAMNGEKRFVDALLPHVKTWDIFSAAALGETKRAAKLLKKDAALARAEESNGWTALHFCAASRVGVQDARRGEGVLAVAALLLANGADANAVSRRAGEYIHPEPPIYHATESPDVLRVLLKHGSDPNPALKACLWARRFELAEELCAQGADCRSEKIAMMLPEFARWGFVASVEWMLNHGADVNAPDAHGRRALHWAAYRNATPAFFELLFAHGADAALKDKAEKTALKIALERKRAGVAALLKKHGAR
jgi:ankyrin repeat protein